MVGQSVVCAETQSRWLRSFNPAPAMNTIVASGYLARPPPLARSVRCTFCRAASGECPTLHHGEGVARRVEPSLIRDDYFYVECVIRPDEHVRAGVPDWNLVNWRPLDYGAKSHARA